MTNKKSAGRPPKPTRHWLIQLRQEKSKTRPQIAKELNVSTQIIQYWESGLRTPRPPIAKKYARVLGFDWTRFYEDNIQNQEKEGG